jgi:hypothetical protein
VRPDTPCSLNRIRHRRRQYFGCLRPMIFRSNPARLNTSVEVRPSSYCFTAHTLNAVVYVIDRSLHRSTFWFFCNNCCSSLLKIRLLMYLLVS